MTNAEDHFKSISSDNFFELSSILFKSHDTRRFVLNIDKLQHKNYLHLIVPRIPSLMGGVGGPGSGVRGPGPPKFYSITKLIAHCNEMPRSPH